MHKGASYSLNCCFRRENPVIGKRILQFQKGQIIGLHQTNKLTKDGDS